MKNITYGLTKDGKITRCRAKKENIGKGRCNHVTHQRKFESTKHFLARAQKMIDFNDYVYDDNIDIKDNLNNFLKRKNDLNFNIIADVKKVEGGVVLTYYTDEYNKEAARIDIHNDVIEDFKRKLIITTSRAIFIVSAIFFTVIYIPLAFKGIQILKYDKLSAEDKLNYIIDNYYEDINDYLEIPEKDRLDVNNIIINDYNRGKSIGYYRKEEGKIIINKDYIDNDIIGESVHLVVHELNHHKQYLNGEEFIDRGDYDKNHNDYDFEIDSNNVANDYCDKVGINYKVDYVNGVDEIGGTIPENIISNWKFIISFAERSFNDEIN